MRCHRRHLVPSPRSRGSSGHGWRRKSNDVTSLSMCAGPTAVTVVLRYLWEPRPEASQIPGSWTTWGVINAGYHSCVLAARQSAVYERRVIHSERLLVRPPRRQDALPHHDRGEIGVVFGLQLLAEPAEQNHAPDDQSAGGNRNVRTRSRRQS